MKLIDHVMHPFIRFQWANKKIKDNWEGKFKQASNFFRVMELDSVKLGLRSVTTTHIMPQELDSKIQEYNKMGIVFLPIQKVGMYKGKSSYHPPVEKGKPWFYYGVLADNITHAEEFAHASDTSNHRKLGELLGFPTCCIDSFMETFLNKIVDPVWQQANKVDNKFVVEKSGNFIKLKDMPWEMNSLLKNFGLMTGFQSYCSTNCEHSLKIAKEWTSIGKDVDGLKELETFLRMPMEWESSKGIAFVRTPLFKASYNSNFSEELYTVQREGSFYPENGAKGIGFPFSEEIYIKFRKAIKGE